MAGDFSVPLLEGEWTRGGQAGFSLRQDLATEGFFAVGCLPGQQPVDERHAVDGPLGGLVACKEHEELVRG